MRKASVYRNVVKKGGDFPPEGDHAVPAVSMMSEDGTTSIYSLRIMSPVLGANDCCLAAGRYHIYISYACPWANRVLATLKMKVPPPEDSGLTLCSITSWVSNTRCQSTSDTVSPKILQGLEDAIGVSIVHPTWQRTKPNDPEDLHNGWTFWKSGDAPFKSPTGMPFPSKSPNNNLLRFGKSVYMHGFMAFCTST